MTSNDIIKALWDCIWCEPFCPTNCPMFKTPKCRRELMKKAFYLINNLKAEIERQEANLKEAFEEVEALKQINLHNTEAIKKFAGELKERKQNVFGCYYVSIEDIDNRVKEWESDTE